MQNLHTHTLYSDGLFTPKEMAESAVFLGFTSLGFSDHAPMIPPSTWSLANEKLCAYMQEVRKVQKEMEGRLDIFLGLELDKNTPKLPFTFDYTIGSVHHFLLNGKDYSVDGSREEFLRALEEGCRGNIHQLLQNYFDLVVDFARNSPYEIQGHFDLPTKWCGKDPVFDPEDPIYQKMARQALAEVVRREKIIEVNTGAISRGYTSAPYPLPFLLKECLRLNAPILLSSDTHHINSIDCAFSKTKGMLKEIGFTHQRVLTHKGWQDELL